MLLHTQPGAPWTEHDFRLLEAYQIIQDETCSCGLPIWVCQNDSNDIQFRVRHVVCNAQRAIDLEREKYTPENRQPPGEQLRPEPYTESGAALSEYRVPYFEGEMKRRQALNAVDET